MANPTTQLTVDSATGGIEDAIGKMLTDRGREDASGARRYIMKCMAAGDFTAAARMMGCKEYEALDLFDMEFPGD